MNDGHRFVVIHANETDVITEGGGQLMKFTYSDELPERKVFLTAQIAGHEVVCSVILPQPELPFSREGVESHFEHGTDFGKVAHYQKSVPVDNRSAEG